jgi:hypothetical protein
MQILGPKRLNRALGRNLLDKGGATDLFGSAPLDLRFALQKTLDPRVTFTRASTGTYVGSDGLVQSATTNEARFDHNPTTGESLGLLVEEARTNLLLNSEDFSTTWTNGDTTEQTNATIAPDGTTTADKLVENTVNIVHNINQNVTVASPYTLSCSFYAKAGERSRVGIWLRGASSANRTQVTFNLSTGLTSDLLNTGLFSGGIASMTAVGNGWYRCFVSASCAAGETQARAYFYLMDGTVTISNAAYTGDGTSGIYLWGAQLEAGAFPTSYIPTTTATVTRAADVASITGSNFSSWYNQTEGTVFADVTVLSTAKANQTISFNDGTSNNRIELRPVGMVSPLQVRTDCVVSGVTKYSNAAFDLAGNRRIGALAIKANDFRMQSGASGVSPTSDAMPTVDRLYLNFATFASGEINGTIKRLTFWPVRLANPTLQAITQP